MLGNSAKGDRQISVFLRLAQPHEVEIAEINRGICSSNLVSRIERKRKSMDGALFAGENPVPVAAVTGCKEGV